MGLPAAAPGPDLCGRGDRRAAQARRPRPRPAARTAFGAPLLRRAALGLPAVGGRAHLLRIAAADGGARPGPAAGAGPPSPGGAPLLGLSGSCSSSIRTSTTARARRILSARVCPSSTGRASTRSSRRASAAAASTPSASGSAPIAKRFPGRPTRPDGSSSSASSVCSPTWPSGSRPSSARSGRSSQAGSSTGRTRSSRERPSASSTG